LRCQLVFDGQFARHVQHFSRTKRQATDVDRFAGFASPQPRQIFGNRAALRE
jgi:hypothetical protein